MAVIKQLQFNYKGKAKLFDALDLELKAGKIYGLLGKNGVGKTTLFRILAGLLFPKGGTCQVFGEKSEQRHVSLLQDLYFLPEEFYLPDLTAANYLNCYSVFYPKFDHEQFLAMLRDLELSLVQPLLGLSYGQKKRFLLAFALASNCRLLLLDEPTNGLDIPSKALLRRFLAASLDENRTFVISTHQVREVENLIDHILILEAGKIIFDHSLLEVERRLKFSVSTNLPSEKIIYKEAMLGGVAFVAANDGTGDSLVNLELLFNAVLANPVAIAALFSNFQLRSENHA